MKNNNPRGIRTVERTRQSCVHFSATKNIAQTMNSSKDRAASPLLGSLVHAGFKSKYSTPNYGPIAPIHHFKTGPAILDPTRSYYSLRLSMRGTKSRFNHHRLQDDAPESSNSNSPNYMKATTCYNARRGSLQTSPACPGTPESNNSSSSMVLSSSNQSSKILRRRKSLRRNSVQTSGSKPSSKHVGDDDNTPPAIKSQKSFKSFASLKRFWKTRSFKSNRSSSRDGDVITSVEPELRSTKGTESSIAHQSVSGEDDTVPSDSEEISSCFLQCDDWQKQERKIRAEAKPQRLVKSRSIKLTKLKSIRLGRRLSKSRLDPDSLFVSGNEADAELGMDAIEAAFKKPENPSMKTHGFTFLARAPSLRSRKSTSRKRAQGSKLRGNPHRPTCSSAEQIELQSGQCKESAKTSTMHVCTYHYCSLHGYHNDPSPPVKSFVSGRRHLLKSQERKKTPQSRSPFQVIESTNAVICKQSRHILSSEDHVGLDSSRVVDTADGNHEGFFPESYTQSEEKLAYEGIQKTDAEAVNRVVIEEMGGPESSFDVSSSTKVPEDEILKELAVAAPYSGSNLVPNDNTSSSQSTTLHSSKDIAEMSSACVVDKLDSTEANEGTQREYPTRNADATSGEEIATGVLTDERKYTNMWQLIYQHSISKIGPEVERRDVTEGGDDQNVDTTNVAEISESESNQEDKQELDMASAVKLVQDAISAILRTQEHPTKNNSTCSKPVDEEEVCSSADDLCRSSPTESARSDDFGEEDIKDDEDTTLVQKNMLQIAEKQCTTRQVKSETHEGNMPRKQMSTGFKKLKKVLAYTKFIRAMENLRMINPQKPRHLSCEVMPEAERVHLRPLSMNERINSDEWMLDHALRQVISKLAPEEQRRVAHLVEAFETINPELKEFSRKRSHTKTEAAIDPTSATTLHKKEDASGYEGSRIPDGSTQEQQKKEVYVASEAAIHRKEDISVVSDNEDLRPNDTDHTASAITMPNGEEECVAFDQNGSRFHNIHVQTPDKDEQSISSATTVQNQEDVIVEDREGSTMYDGSAQKPKVEEQPVVSITTVNNKEEKIVASSHEDSATTACNEDENFDAADHEDSSLCDRGIEEKNTKAVTFGDPSLFKPSLQENNPVNISSLNKELYDDLASNTFNLQIHNQASKEGCSVCQPLDTPTNSEEKTDSSHKDKLLSRSPSNDDSGHGNKTNILKSILLDKDKYNSMWLLLIQQVQSSNAAAEAEGQTVDKGSEEGAHNHGITSSDKVVDGENNDAGYKKLELTQSDAVRLVQEAVDGILRQNGSSEPESPVTSNNPDGEPLKATKNIFQAGERLSEVKVGELGISTSSDSAYDTFQATDTKANSISGDATINSEENQRGLSEENSKIKISRAYSKLRKAVLCNKFIKAMEKMQKVHPQKHEFLLMEPGPGYKNISLRPSSIDNSKNAEQWMLDYALQKVIAKLAPSQQRRVALLVNAFEKVKPDAEKTSKEQTSNKTEQTDSMSSSSSKLDQPSQQLQYGECDFGSENLSTDGQASETIVEFSSINNNRDAALDHNGVILPPCTEQVKEEPAAGKDVYGDSDKAKDFVIDNEDDNSPLETPRYSSMWNLIYRHVKSGIAENSEVQSPSGQVIDHKRRSYQSSEADDDDMETQSTDSTYSELQEQDAIKLVEEAVNELFLVPNQLHEEQSTGQEDYHNTEGDSKETSISAVEHDKTTPNSTDKTNQNLSNLSKIILCKRFIKAMEKRRKLKPKGRRYLPEHPNSERETVRLRNRGTSEKDNYDDWMLDNALQQVIGKLAPAQKKRVSLLVQAFETVGPQPGADTQRRVNTAA